MWRPEKRNGKWGFVDERGELVIPPEWDYAYGFTCELAAVEKDGKWGYIDRKGQLVLPLQWERAYFFTTQFGPYYAAVRKDGRWGLIDTQGNYVVPCRWELLGVYHLRNWLVVCEDASDDNEYKWLWQHFDLKTGELRETMHNSELCWGEDIIDLL